MRSQELFTSSDLKSKIDQLMDSLYSGGVNNPIDAIEQISYLLFLRILSERDEQLARLDKNYKPIFSGEWSKYGWGNFVTLTGDALLMPPAPRLRISTSFRTYPRQENFCSHARP